MGDYIERQEAIMEIYTQCDKKHWADILLDIPPADVVPVVRCRDCKHYFAYPDDFRTCHEHYEIDGASRKVSPDSFCSFGERREDDE